MVIPYRSRWPWTLADVGSGAHACTVAHLLSPFCSHAQAKRHSTSECDLITAEPQRFRREGKECVWKQARIGSCRSRRALTRGWLRLRLEQRTCASCVDALDWAQSRENGDQWVQKWETTGLEGGCDWVQMGAGVVRSVLFCSILISRQLHVLASRDSR